MVRGGVFVGTRVGGMSILVGSLEDMMWNGRLMVLTHYFLLESPSSNLDDETKEMSGEERQVCEL